MSKSLLHFLVLLSLALWVGGIVFFAFAVAPSAFSILRDAPSGGHLAGNIVSRTLTVLHYMGIVSGMVLIGCFLAASRKGDDSRHKEIFLVAVMLAGTCTSQFAIVPKMESIRGQLGEINAAPISDSRRQSFDGLHRASTRIEVGVLLLGLTVMALTARRMS